MKLDPFIEAEKIAGHSVAKTCDLFEVSKSAYYQRRNGAPSARDVTDAELLEQIKAIHKESKGTYGAPRVHKELLPSPHRLRQAQGDQAYASGRPRRQMQEALAQDHGGRPGGRGGPRPDPAPLRAVCGDRPALCRRHHLHRNVGGLGLPGHSHRPGQPPGRRLGPGRSHAHRTGQDALSMAFANRAPAPGRHLPPRPRLSRWNQLVVATPRSWRCAVRNKNRQKEIRLYRGHIPSPGRPGIAWREDRVKFWAAIARGLKTEEAGCRGRRLIPGRVPVVPPRWWCEPLPSPDSDRSLLVVRRARGHRHLACAKAWCT